jgi:hypothetical protein
MTKMTKAQKAERDEAINTLREWVKPGDTIHTIVTHVARSGMQRSIKLFRTYVEDGKAEIHEISYLAARAMNDKIDQKNGGIKIGGCGMDMGFHLVYNLGRTLFPEGGSLEATSPIRKHQAERAGETKEKDGGYLLKHHWI